MSVSKHYDVMTTIDNGITKIKNLDPDKWGQWLTYFAEAVESELGEDALKTLYQAISERFERGGW